MDDDDGWMMKMRRDGGHWEEKRRKERPRRREEQKLATATRPSRPSLGWPLCQSWTRGLVDSWADDL